MEIWIAEWIYDDNGTAKVKTGKIKAESYDEAKALAAKIAPAKDFVLSLHPESEDQYLGQVNHKAQAMSGNADSGDAEDGG